MTQSHRGKLRKKLFPRFQNRETERTGLAFRTDDTAAQH